MEKHLIKEGLVCAVIILFIGIAVQPGIVANDSSDLNLVSDSKAGVLNKNLLLKFILLSFLKNREVKLDKFFDIIKSKLDRNPSLDESVAIIKDAIIKLKALRFLPQNMNIAQILKTLDGKAKVLKTMSSDENFNCLIVGKTNYTSGGKFITYKGDLILGWQVSFFEDGHSFCPARGWVWTNGINGIKKWEGSFYGLISSFYEDYEMMFYTYYVGVTGFTGISIGRILPTFPSYYFGFAEHVSIGSNHP